MATTAPRRDSLALMFTMLFPCAMAWLYFVELARMQAQSNQALQIAFGLGKAIQFLFPAMYVWWVERERLALRSPNLRGVGVGAGFGVLVGAATLAIYFFWLKHSEILGDTPARILGKVHEFGVTGPLGFLVMGFFISVVHSLFEEYYWRWFVFGTLKRYLPVAGAIVVSSIGFMLHHIVILGVYFPAQFWTLALPFAVCVGVGGGVWAWIYHRTGSLYAAWLSHALIDAAILYVGFDMVADQLQPIWWNADF